MVYAHSPSPSTTSLSEDDDDVNKSSFFPSEPAKVAPARWSSKLQSLSDASPSLGGRSAASALPAEILILVLRYIHSPQDLYHCLLVSRMWCECSVDLLWHKPSMTRSGTLLKLMRVLSREDTTFLYSRFIRRLNFLSLASDLSDNLFMRFAKCIRLERLTLVNCKHLTDDALCRVLPACPNLVAVDLTGVVAVTDRSIVGLATACTRLQGINLGGCKQVTPVGILSLALHCPLLRRIKLSGVERLDDEAVSALAVSCPLLLEIDVFECQLITDQSIRDLWIHSVHMREMRISHCKELTDLAFPAAVKPDNPDDRPNPFPSILPNVNDRLAPLLLTKPFEHLRMLDLTACANLTDESVEGIISNAPKIRNLFLAKCSQLTNTAIEAIGKLEKHLHYLHLGHCANITDPAIQALARSCTRLRYIDLANCTLLTDLSVFELATLPKLRRIGLVRVTNLTDEAVYALSNRHATLERIHLSYCDRISVVAIHYLLIKLRKLTHLSLTGIPSFRRPELQQFCRQPPREYNSSQRTAFCVYSGQGVASLRDYLASVVNNITDEIVTSEGEELEIETYSHEQHSFPYPAEDVDMVMDLEDEDETGTNHDGAFDARPTSNGAASTVTSHTSLTSPNPQFSAALVGSASLQLVIRHNSRTSRTIPGSGFGLAGGDSNASGATTALRSTVREHRGPRRSRALVVEDGTQIEQHPSTLATFTAANSSDTPSDIGAAFYQAYGTGTRSPSPGGVLTPELIYAEIGHGRGAAGSHGHTALNGLTELSAPVNASSTIPPSQPLPPMRSPSPATRELQESVYTALTAPSNTLPMHGVSSGSESDRRGRRGKRGFGARLTEAGSYIFGRGNSPGSGGSGSGSTSAAASRNPHNN